MSSSPFSPLLRIASQLVNSNDNVVQVGLVFSVASLVVYLSSVKALRWRRFTAIHLKYRSKYESGTLTPEEAQEIIATVSQYDMPLLVNYSLSFALFKTYSIPTISKILLDTKELGSAQGVAKRYADTEILISTWSFCPISAKAAAADYNKSQSSVVDDPRAMIALARVNWLHSKYPITNDDYLYTLGLFIFEPEKWARMYGWRAFSPMEAQAFYIFWAEIGRRMAIKDIPETREEFQRWITEYEQKAMVPAKSNQQVSNYTMDEVIHIAPEVFGLKRLAKRLATCALDDNVRVAMMQPVQPPYLHKIFRGLLHSLAFIQGHLCLPRSQSNRGGAIEIPLDKVVAGVQTANLNMNGKPAPLLRMHPKWFQSQPWYMPEPQTVLGKIKTRVIVALGLHDSLPESKFRSEGYRLEEMGPPKFEKSGHEEVMRMAEELYGCPISGPFSRS